MAKNQKLGGNALGRIILGSAIVVLIAGTPLFLTRTALAANAGYMRIIIEGAQSPLDGASKDPAHLNWNVISSVVSADLNGDATADRESSAPSVSEVTASHAIGSATSGAGAGKAASDSWSAPTSKAAIGSATSGAGAGKVTASAPRDMATGMASGKRMHKPFTITKEIDKSSPS